MFKIIVFGVPGNIGGASTELWHTVKLWRANDCEVTIVPTWGDYEKTWQARCEQIGCKIIRFANANAFDLDVRGKLVYGMCSKAFLEILPRLAEAGGIPVWSNCMCWAFDKEKANLELIKGFHFQSEFQRTKLLEAYGSRVNYHVIRGAFDVNEWEYRPKAHEAGAFFIGRLARADLHKWSSNTLKVYNLICYYPKNALLMGVTPEVRKKLGEPPGWVNYLNPGVLEAESFYRTLHCLLPINGGAMENWPRVGLEAMACGVPIVTQDEWGWQEMLEHGVSGYLGKTDEQLAHYCASMAHDEGLRLCVAAKARERLEDLTDPAKLWDGWHTLFTSAVAS